MGCDRARGHQTMRTIVGRETFTVGEQLLEQREGELLQRRDRGAQAFGADVEDSRLARTAEAHWSTRRPKIAAR